MTAKIILNPYVNRWKALKRVPELEAALKAVNLDYDLIICAHIGHGGELAAQAVVQGYNPIIATGGDTTLIK